jgi:hypothetical protein
MKTIQKLCISIFLAALVGGCIATDSKTLPQPSPGFTPKKTYAVSQDKLWTDILDALDKNRVTVVSSDKGSGVIQTDYVGGPSRLIGLGLVAAQSTRYKFNITVRSQSEGSTRVNIVSRVESTMSGRSGSSQWNDVTVQNVKIADELEGWLYEQIEKGL